MSKVVSLGEAASMLHDGDHLALGGFACTRNAMAFAHEIIRQGRRDLTISGAVLGMEADLLVGAGLVKRAIYGGGSIDRFGTIQCVNRAYERGEIVSEYYSSLALCFRYMAGALGIPFIPMRSMLGSDLLKRLEEETAPESVGEMDDPFTGQHVVVLRALVPDVTVIHAQMADADGNTRIYGPLWDNNEAAKAARDVIVTVEQIVSTDVIRQQPELTIIPGIRVRAVVEVPFGGHPTAVYRSYDYDADHLKLWAARARTDSGVREYIEEFVLGTTDFMDYLERIGGLRKLSTLRADPQLGY